MILWQGQPKQGIIFRKIDIFHWLFVAIVFFGFSDIITAEFFETLTINFSRFFLVSFIFFVIIYGVLGRILHDQNNRSKIIYILTNKRVCVCFKSMQNIVFEKTLTKIKPSVVKLSENFGSITFGEHIADFYTNIHNGGWPSKMILFKRFENINDAQTVYKILIKAQENIAAT